MNSKKESSMFVGFCVCLMCLCVSLSTIVKISKSAGSLLKPHISLLVVSLLESITTLEPQMVNYLSLHAAANQDAAEKVSLSSRMPCVSLTNAQNLIFCLVFYLRSSVYSLSIHCTQNIQQMFRY